MDVFAKGEHRMKKCLELAGDNVKKSSQNHLNLLVKKELHPEPGRF